MPSIGVPVWNQPFVDKTGNITRGWRAFLVNLFDAIGGSAASNTFSTGDSKTWFASAVPDGWLACNGQAVSRTTYSALFAILGVTWGIGDGSTTFNLPDLRGRSLLGADGATYNVGDYGGAHTVTLSTAQLPAHSHPVTDPTHTHAFTGAAHTHGVTDPGHVHTAAAVSAGTGTLGITGDSPTAANTGSATTGITVDNATATGTNAAAATGVTVGNTGGGDPVPTQSPYAAVLILIKT